MKTLTISDGQHAIVDDQDFERVGKYKWTASKRKFTTYATRYTGGGRRSPKRIYLHRFILAAKHGKEVDHINGNGLDCRRLNLRLCTTQENRRNQRKSRGKSIYKGVSKRARSSNWRAYINVGGKHKDLGEYVSEYEAGRVYDRAAIEYFGAFAKTNFPIDNYLSVVGPLPTCGAEVKNSPSLLISWRSKRDAEQFLHILRQELNEKLT
ncbi:hypothetical protein LCGC14_1136610 [marine sediment metagenome]|uniref:AP2/ERF domain-containing protein n=1 Tax=marine sediment metagenome TaxID=412755 RepID=A0A0F9PHN9_9ZZZZ